MSIAPLLLTVEEVSEALNLSRSKIYELMAAGRLPSCAIGRTRRIPADALRRWVDAQVQPKNGLAAHDKDS